MKWISAIRDFSESAVEMAEHAAYGLVIYFQLRYEDDKRKKTDQIQRKQMFLEVE